MSDLGVAENLVKKFYANGLHPQMIESQPLLEKIIRDKTDIGQDYTYTVMPEGPQGIGNRNLREALPDPGQLALDRGLWTPQSMYVRVQVDGKDVRRTRNDKRALAKIVQATLDQALRRASKDMNFQLYRTGTGLRALTEGAVVASAGNVTITAETAADLRGVYPGSKLDFYEPNGGPILTANVKVISVAPRAGTFVVESLDVDLPDATEIYRNGNKGREFLGLNGIINNTSGPATVCGILTSNSWWQAYVSSNGGTLRDLSLPLMEEIKQNVMIQNNQEPDYWFMDYTQYQKIQNALTRLVNYQSDGKALKMNGGGSVEMYGKGQIVTDSDMLPGVVFATQMKEDIRLGDDYGIQWMDMDGAVWKYVQGYDLWEAVAVYDGNCYTHQRNLHGKGMDLTLS